MNLSKTPCKFCETAKHRTDYPLFAASCHGCTIRSLAAGPQFHACASEGRVSETYKAALKKLFGDQWQEAHQEVRACRDRERAMGRAL